MVDLSIDPVGESARIIKFLQTSLTKTGFSRLIIGLSGGIDSSLVASLAVKALGSENVYIAILPYGKLGNRGLSMAEQLVNKLTIIRQNVSVIDIKPSVDQIISSDRGVDKLRKGNIMARVRMTILYDLAKKHNCLVCGTENKTEYLLGYFTRFGDEASDIEPIRHLYKTQLRQLAQYLGLPGDIITSVPTADLWAGQTDEGDFGFSYAEADQILYLYYDKKLSKEEIVKSGFNSSLVAKVLKRVGDNDFKHGLPYTIDS